ncbi:DUF4395 domain-containing protein [Pedobacter yonginense]|uniref:DUF4395 domain-containing protein n=1 Tax=Pedobacter yonginense TaxID=651869 RepID=A0A317ERA1_9SPHI|nr:DUF4395 domain-containing protein [Pedobacter yonginense]PWS28363.1 DUF4395 domain-containing protein [Pedobacter yonginense]
MEISCPVSAERVNEHVVRIIAFMVALTAIFSIFFDSYFPIVLLTFDFALRAFTTGKFSPLKFVAIQVSKALNLKPKMTDLAPKKFAATMGFVFCLLIVATFMLSLNTVSLILTSMLTIFALLESVFAICLGCYVYSILQILKKNNS